MFAFDRRLTMQRRLSYPLFGCFDNPWVSVITYVAPCVTAGMVAHKTGRSCPLHCVLFVFLPPASLICRCLVRGDISQSEGCVDRTEDFLVHLLLFECALCQEARETGALDEIIQEIARF